MQTDRRPTNEPVAEIVVDANDLCGECPVWDELEQRLYWTDMTGTKFHSHSPESGETSLVDDQLEISSFRRNGRSDWMIANGLGIWLWDETGLSQIASQVEGYRAQLNDCTADPLGRLIAGSAFYTPNENYEKGRLFCFDPDGRHSVLDEGFDLANGLAFSPGGGTIYATDSIARRIYAYDYDATTGSVCRRRILIQVPSNEGIPDGLAVDGDGFLWSAQWYGGCVVRYDPDGKEERRIFIPAKQTSSVTFGGPDLSDLYITSASKPESTPVMPPGYDCASGPFGGQLFRLKTDIRGQATWRTRFWK